VGNQTKGVDKHSTSSSLGLIPYQGKRNLPGEMKKAVRWLRRPYKPISLQEHDRLQAQLVENGTDFLIDKKGALFTIGNADGGHALMPIAPEHWDKIKTQDVAHRYSA